MKSINDIQGNQPILFTLPTEKSKHQFEYQDLCTELEKIYGKLVWSLPFKPNFTEYKIRKAHEIAKGKGITTFAYLYGVIKKLP